MNLYDILNVSHNASKADIKKAYCKLIIQYHPDKIENPTEETYKKFHDVQSAYEILYDDDKRKEYDNMSNEEKMKIHDIIKEYFINIKPQYSYIYNSILVFVYSNKEDELKEDINTFNVKNIFNKIITRIRNEAKIKHNKKFIEITESVHNLKISLKDRYNNSFKYVRIKSNNDIHKDIEYVIPIHEPQFIIKDPNKGSITINITYDTDPNFEIINKYDLFHIKFISLSQYIYGGKIKIYHLNDEVIWLDFDSCLEKKPVFKIEGKGLSHDGSVRGDLYVYLKIEGIDHNKNNDKDDVYKSYTKVVEETIKLMFPPINC